MKFTEISHDEATALDGFINIFNIQLMATLFFNLFTEGHESM